MATYHPRYGRFLEEFEPGTKWRHPRAITVREGLADRFAGAFMEANPIYRSQLHAEAAGYPRSPVHPLLVLAVTMSLGVENNSEQTLGHLGYHDLRFLSTVFPGETIHAESEVLDVRARDNGPGIVTVITTGRSDGRACIRYRRVFLVPSFPEQRPRRWAAPVVEITTPTGSGEDPEGWKNPAPRSSWPGPPDLRPGDVVVHPLGRTITDEHLEWAFATGNTHPLHFDRVYTGGLQTQLAGEPVVYGGLILAWVLGLTSRDVAATSLGDVAYDAGFHLEPTRSSDTLFAISRVEARDDLADGTEITFRHVGLRNITAVEAWDRHGADLFSVPEASRPARLPGKCLEITRVARYANRQPSPPSA